MNKIPFSEYQVEQALAEKFPAPQFAFLPQVRSATGYSGTARTADAIAMSLWPSRGLDIIGFEIKRYRSDWLRELKDPSKAERICRFCDRWWIVAAAEGVVKEGELPSTWGLMVFQGKKLIIKMPAPELEAQSISKSFLAAVLRRAQDIIVPQAKLKEAFRAGRDEERKDAKKEEPLKIKLLKQDLATCCDKVAAFEKSSGVKITKWDAGDIGQAVKMVIRSEHLRVKERLANLRSTAQNIVKSIDDELEKHTQSNLSEKLILKGECDGSG